MEICKKCGKPFIPVNGKCVYCGSSRMSIKASGHFKFKVKKRSIDLVVCVDLSLSMQSAIGNIQKNILRLLQNWEDLYVVHYYWRVKIVGFYSDKTGSGCVFIDNPFVSSIEELVKQFKSLEAINHINDKPSPTLDAILYVLKETDWTPPCILEEEEFIEPDPRLLAVFTDSPYSPLHTSTLAKFGQEYCDSHQLFYGIMKHHIQLYLWCPNDSFYQSMQVIPKSHIICLDAPIDEYLREEMDLSMITDVFGFSIS